MSSNLLNLNILRRLEARTLKRMNVHSNGKIPESEALFTDPFENDFSYDSASDEGYGEDYDEPENSESEINNDFFMPRDLPIGRFTQLENHKGQRIIFMKTICCNFL